MIKKLVAGVMAVVATTISPSFAGDVHEEHLFLAKTLVKTGIRLHINQEKVCDDGTDGTYFPAMGALVLCQDNAKANGEVVDFTENDLNTLRHEAWHVVQDCKDGALGGNLIPVLNDKYRDMLYEQAKMDKTRKTKITRVYREMGAPYDVVRVEIEAFAAADVLPATIIAQALNKECN